MTHIPILLNKIKFLEFNGFTINDDNLIKEFYDDNLELPNSDNITLLIKNISKYLSISIESLNKSIYNKFWNDHHFFIQTFEKEKKNYNNYGIDSWIDHFIDNFNKIDELYQSLNYPKIIGFELNQDIPIKSFEFKILGNKSNLFKQYICKKKYKLSIDGEKIKVLFDAFTELPNKDEILCENKSSLCFCKTDYMKYLISNDKCSYNTQYSESNLNFIHNKFCCVHSTYLDKNKDQLNNFINFNNDKWISYLKDKYNPSFKSLVDNKPEDYNLYSYNLINLVQDNLV